MSGGLDSVCFASLLSRTGSDLYTITFDYDQRARPEIARAGYFSKNIGSKEHKLVDISFMKSLYGESNALTCRELEIGESFQEQLIVPVRNAVFLTIAAAWAMSIDAGQLAYGAHLGDVPRYPDCRPKFARSLQDSLNLAESDSITSGKRHPLEIVSPAIQNLNKAALLSAGYNRLGDKLFRTWSCYTAGSRIGTKLLHCGRCESCISRKKAFNDTNIQDKTGYADGSGKIIER